MRGDPRVFAEEGDLLGGSRGFAASRAPPIRPDLSRMEAWTLRKALLVVTLVFASFAGGAVVNGPGLSWLKGIIGDRLHRGDAIPTLDVDDGPPVAVADSEPSPPPATPEAAKPARPPPAGLPEPPAPRARRPTPARPGPPAAPVSASPPPSDPPADALRPRRSQSPCPSPNCPRRHRTEGARLPSSRQIRSTRPRPHNPAAGFEDAPGPAPETAVLPRSRPARDRAPRRPTPPSPPPPAPRPNDPPAALPVHPRRDDHADAGRIAPTPGDWAALRKRMKALGVTRYWVEGSPSGAVTFRCVVPSGGADAANRQFEAEADDERQAAESALRRVAVWKAAERIKK